MPAPTIPSIETSLPTKRVLSQAHLKAFQASQTHTDVLSFVEELNESVKGKKLTDSVELSEPVQRIISLLESIQSLADSIPPVDNSLSRFGNPAFKTFYNQLCSRSFNLQQEFLGSLPLSSSKDEPTPAQDSSVPTPAPTSTSTSTSTQTITESSLQEINTYFTQSWGNEIRIDYGSGHELNFLCWLLCLRKLGMINREDNQAIVLRVFWKYIQIMRYLQSTYWLEPAGSHGVWGLDDYHFLPFLWGSGQLDGHKHLRPKSIHDPEILEAFSKDYMYFACVSFINSIKTASLRWHSPMLDDISAVKTWSKVNSGMLKMYTAEVLGKLPVIQHFLFGTLLPFPSEPESGISLDQDEEAKREMEGHGHVHAKKESGWTLDCCGIPVPSAFAAARAEAASGVAERKAPPV